MQLYDLHTHSNISDGTLSPAELVRKAHSEGLTAIALTDHDAAIGYTEAAAGGERLGIHVISGVEISASEYNELHILGLGIDINSSGLKTEIDKCAESRRSHIYTICNSLREKGVVLDADAIIASAEYSVGKPHVANAMVEKGYVKTKNEAFDKYLETPEMKILKKYKIGYKKAAELIHKAGGLVVLAHPHKIELTDMTLDEFINGFIELDGIEAFYSEHSPQQTEKALELAEKYGLLISCGSDFHGANKPDIELGTGIDGSLVKLREQFKIDEKRLVINALI